MRCPNCGTENRPGARFCKQCAGRLSPDPAPGGAAPGASHVEGSADAVGPEYPAAPQASPKASLVIQRGSQAGQTFTLHEGTNTVGRAPDNDVLLPEGSVSRHHARIVVRPEGVWIEDLGSTVGTFVNGQRVTDATWLRSGDRVQVGGAVTLGVRVAPGMAPRPAPPSRTRARGDADAVRPAQHAAAPTYTKGSAAAPTYAKGSAAAPTRIEGGADAVRPAQRAADQVCPKCGAQNPPGQRFCGQCASPLETPAPAAPHARPSKAPRRRWIWAMAGAAALVVVVVAAGVIGMRMLSETPGDIAMEKGTPTGGGPVTEEEARQIVQDVVEHAFPQFVESDPSFYRAECEDKSFYRATYSAEQAVTDGDGNSVGLMEIVSISVDEETGEISVAASN